MHSTAADLQATASLISRAGLHAGTQFASPSGALDICAAAYAVTRGHIPAEFYDDETAALRLIEANPRAMAAIKAISDVLDSTVCETRTDDGTSIPDYIEHVSNWAATAPVGATQPPTVSEVIGRILRAANHTQTHAA